MTAVVSAIQDSGWPPRMIVEATDVGVEGRDAFGRTLSNAWGTSDSGQVWGNSGGSASDFSVGSGVGSQLCTSPGTARLSTISVTPGDLDLTATFIFGATPAGGTAQAGLTLFTGGVISFMFEVIISTSDVVTVQLRKLNGVSFSTLAGPTSIGLTHTAGMAIALRFDAVGSTISGRAWDASTAEPGTWQVTASDPDVLPPPDGTSVAVGCRSITNTGNTNGSSHAFKWDNFVATDIDPVVSLDRLQNGIRTPMRATDAVVVSDTALVRYDGEMSYGLPVTYILVVNGFDIDSSSPVTPTLPGGQVALSDAITGLAVECKLFAWQDRTADRGATTFNVGGRTVAVSPPRGGFASDIEVWTETETTREQMIALLDGATSGIILIRVPDASVYKGFDSHLFVLSDDEQLITQSGTSERRRWVLGVVESDGWATELDASGWTYGDVENAYLPHGNYADLEGDYASYLAVAVWDWGMGHS